MKWITTFLILLAISGCNVYDQKKIRELKKDIRSMATSFEEDEKFLYIVDASCSVCILDAIYFITAYNKSRVKIPCYILISESNKELFAYYLKQHIEETNALILHRHEEYPFGISTRGVLYISDKDNNIIRRLR